MADHSDPSGTGPDGQDADRQLDRSPADPDPADREGDRERGREREPSDPSVTSGDVTPSAFDPADPDDAQLRSLTRLHVKYVYDRLVEKGHGDLADELREHAGAHRLPERAAELSREYLTDDEKAQLPLRWR